MAEADSRYGTLALRDGTEIRLRPIRWSDKELMRALFYRLSPETIHRRFFTLAPDPPEHILDHLVSVDGRNRVAIVAARGDQLIAVARFDRNLAEPSEAEVAVLVEDTYQGKGVGHALMTALAGAAWARGITRFTATALGDNVGILKLLEASGYEFEHRISEGVAELEGTFPDPGTVLRGERVVLRPLLPDDIDAVTEILADPQVAQWWATVDTASVEHLLADSDHVPIVVTVDGELAGFVLWEEERNPAYRHAGMDLALGPRFRGKGYGTDAVRTLAQWLVEAQGHHRLVIDPAASNTAAIAAYQRVGFRIVGTMREYEQGPDGTWHDGVLMELLASDL